MSELETPDPEATALAAAGDDVEETLGELWKQHRRRLLKMVHLRMDPRVKGRVGASDVLQDAYVEVNRRVRDYVANPRMPFFLWLRFITAQQLIALQRRHIGAKKRDVRRQVDAGIPGASTPALVDQLMGGLTTPTQRIAREEQRLQVAAALDQMDADDREILVLRHFEELSNIEAAAELDIKPPAASKRYVRALARMQAILEAVGAGPDASTA
ncbi:MAG: sigma-70 family RNA polymerase sigma factor [Planctomycetota bacterium]|nr:sigma-70 family RNA polymerase sigma factor [Planctomycetota bacterium]